MNQSVNGSCQSCCILLEVKLTVRRAALALPYLRICRVRAFQGETFKENDVVIFWPSHRQNREQDCLRFCTVGQMVPCNQDESLSVSHHDLCTGPLARSHALLTSSLAPHCALYLRAPLRLVVRLLALALLSIWESVIFEVRCSGYSKLKCFAAFAASAFAVAWTLARDNLKMKKKSPEQVALHAAEQEKQALRS